MRGHPKESPVFTPGRDTRVASRDTRSFAIRGASSDLDGRGASAAARGSRHLLGLLLVPAVALVILAMSVPAADAATQRPFKGTFGSAAQPTFLALGTVAVDPDSGDVLIADRFADTIRRFKPDGTPSPFTALGSNIIDGKEANGKPCAEEPASCDMTPQKRIVAETAGQQARIAIDNSGGPTDGNIYVAQPTTSLFENEEFIKIPPVINVFGSDGKYLGQITDGGSGPFGGNVCGVAVDPAGVIYAAAGITGGNQEIIKYVPTANPPTNEDYVETFPRLPPGKSVCSLAIGKGPTADYIFGTGSQVAYKFDKETGELQYEFAFGYVAEAGIAVDPVTGNLLIARAGSSEEYGEFDASGDTGVKVGRILGEGLRLGMGLAFSNSGNEVYAGLGLPHNTGAVYGAPAVVPTVTVDAASEVTGSKALLTGTVDPEGLAVTECFFEYGKSSLTEKKATCEGAIPTDSTPHVVRAKLSSLLPNGQTYRYRIVAKNANGREESPIQTFVTANTVVTEAPSPVGTTTATLRGTVRPEGAEYSACFFEYGLASSASAENSVPCTPSAAAIEPDFAPHQVSAPIGGLQAGESYRFRLVATNANGTLKGEELTFTTLGKPRIGEIRARDADQSSVTLEAKINPSGFGTSYHFEWGPTDAYGNDVPADFEPFIGSGTDPVLVTATISGLSAETVYHYRVVATNSIGTAESPDRIFETLNSCGLPKQRCFELVSPRDAGPVASPGDAPASAELRYQAAPNPGSLAYVVETGFPDSTRGAEVLYRGTRGSSGWTTTQLSAPILVPSETNTANSNSSQTMALSPDLSCGVVGSNQPLTSDASTRAVVEAGGSNLYRRNPDGSYTAITKLTPTNFETVTEFFGSEYLLDGMSPDCGKIVFRTPHAYPGVPAVPKVFVDALFYAYEWDEGELRALGLVPGPSGEVAVSATAGTPANHSNVVSADGSRVFFSAERQTSPNPAEIGQTGIFVRENGTITRDLSLSETSTPNTGATYQYATKDGSRVFFTADAGLTDESSVEGTDLYEYNLDTEDLTDLTTHNDQGGARVSGFIGASEDGSHVYFAAKGQLVPGKGKTFAQNQSAGTSSIYGAADGHMEYVGPVRDVELQGGYAVSVEPQESTTSRVSGEGDYLLFQTSANVTGYESGGARQAYLYSAITESTVCVSCRPDGQPSLNDENAFPLVNGITSANPLYQPPSLVMNGGIPSVFFYSRDRLAFGAVEGLYSLYEWSHDQVFAIDSEGPGHQSPTAPPLAPTTLAFVGANADGSDLYFATTNTLTWEDGDERFSVYDARVGGGNPEPLPPPASCDPTREGSCQGSPVLPATVPGAASATFRGPGNVKPKKSQKRQKKHHKRQHQKKKHQKKQGKHKIRANGDRRAGK